MKPYYLNLSKYQKTKTPDEVVFKPDWFGLHVFFPDKTTGYEIEKWALSKGYVLVGSAQMVYVDQQ